VGTERPALGRQLELGVERAAGRQRSDLALLCQQVTRAGDDADPQLEERLSA